MDKKVQKIGLFPFGKGGNPYTQMVAEGVAEAGYQAVPLQDTKFFPIRKACQSGVDLVHMFWPSNFYHSSTQLGTWTKRLMFSDGINCLRRTPFIYSADNLYPHDADSSDFEITQIQKLINVADGIIVASNSAESIFRKTYQVPTSAIVQVVPHCNYIGKYPDKITKTEARIKLGLHPHEKVLLSLGRINRYKGLERLKEAFLRANVKDSHLLIAGSCSDLELLEEISRVSGPANNQAKVTVHNKFIPNDEIQIYMRASDGVILSYDDIPMNPGSVILAMSFGLPVCCVDTGSVSEILSSSCLFPYQPKNLDSMVAAIIEILECANLAERGRKAYEIAQVKHSPTAIATRLKEIYAQVI